VTATPLLSFEARSSKKVVGDPLRSRGPYPVVSGVIGWNMVGRRRLYFGVLVSVDGLWQAGIGVVGMGGERVPVGSWVAEGCVERWP